VIRKNGIGVHVDEGKLILRGGTISENKGNGVSAWVGGKVTVAKAEEDKPQTVCKSNKQEDWCTIHPDDEDGGEGGEIIGISQEKLNVRNSQ